MPQQRTKDFHLINFDVPDLAESTFMWFLTTLSNLVNTIWRFPEGNLYPSDYLTFILRILNGDLQYRITYEPSTNK